MVVGLDSAPPRLLYDELAGELPTLSRLVGDGWRAELISSHPPITIPAWAVMVTGKSPGELGLYGFRHRKPGDYTGFYIANSRMVREPTVWDELGRRGLTSIVVGVPPSYPPKPLRGLMVGCFITPGPGSQYTFPPSLKRTIESRFGPYIFDVVYRSEEKDRVREELWRMTRQHFAVLRYLASRRWDFMMFVEIGVDRVHHAFWGFMDPSHRKYRPGNKYEGVVREYYKMLDSELGTLLREVPRDTVVMVVSDHGAKAMKGAFAVNQWLAEMGYLRLEGEHRPGTELSEARVDWSRTVAWGWGGYYARIFINLKGREPKGVVDPRDYEHYRQELKEELERVRGPNGERWGTRVYRPEELYPVVRGDAPDLIAYFDDLSWRSAGTVGWPSPYLRENDRGPDDAVHDWRGVLAVYDPEGTLDRGPGPVPIQRVRDIMLEVVLGERAG